MSDCIFCKIISGDIPSSKVYENEKVYAFKDLHPLAKEHYLFIHKEHSKNVNEMMDINPDQVRDIYIAIADYTKSSGLDQKGFRVVTNLGEDAGQTVFHTHFHVLSGEKLGSFGR